MQIEQHWLKKLFNQTKPNQTKPNQTKPNQPLRHYNFIKILLCFMSKARLNNALNTMGDVG
jgi:hypothetical protein